MPCKLQNDRSNRHALFILEQTWLAHQSHEIYSALVIESLQTILEMLQSVFPEELVITN